MADDILERAIRKREALAGEMRKLDQFISTYKMLAASEIKHIKQSKSGGMYSFTQSSNMALLAGSPSMGGGLTQEEAAIGVLNEYGPMPVKEIVFRLEAMGYKVGGKDPTGNLSSILSHSERVKFDKATRRWL